MYQENKPKKGCLVSRGWVKEGMALIERDFYFNDGVRSLTQSVPGPIRTMFVINIWDHRVRAIRPPLGLRVGPFSLTRVSGGQTARTFLDARGTRANSIPPEQTLPPFSSSALKYRKTLGHARHKNYSPYGFDNSVIDAKTYPRSNDKKEKKEKKNVAKTNFLL